MVMMLERGHEEMARLPSLVEGLRLLRADTPSELSRLIEQVDALLIMNPYYTAEVAALIREKGKNVRWMQFATSGYDRLEQHGVPSGLIVTNAGSAWGPTVAEHAMALVLALQRQLHRCERERVVARWGRDRIAPALGTLEERVLTCVGYGAIGQGVARRAKAFGMHVIAVNRSGRRRGPDDVADEVFPVRALTELLPRTDVLVLCLPQDASTTHLIGREELAALPSSALLINVARGPIVNEDALIAALRRGELGGAGLDVFDQEPLPADSPLWSLDNIILTPHVAGYGGLAIQRLVELVAANAQRFLRGEKLLNTVAVS